MGSSNWILSEAVIRGATTGCLKTCMMSCCYPKKEEFMKRRDLVRAGMVAAACGAFPLGNAFAQQKMVWKASDVHPLGYPTVEAIERMGKKLDKATNGRITIQMYPSMQLGGEKEMNEQAQVGALQIARVSA